MSAFEIQLPDVVRVSNLTEFHILAGALGVELSGKGRLPKGKVARAVLDSGRTIDDTEFLATAHADAGSVSGSGGEYGKRKHALIAEREAAIAKAHTDYKAALAALRAEYDMPETPEPRATGNAFKVSAKTVVVDNSGETPVLKRTKPTKDAPEGKPRFGPVRSVVLTSAEVRDLVDGTGARGKTSKAHTLHAAVIKGEWLPVSLLNVADWESVLLSDVTIEPVMVEPVAADTPVAESAD